MATRRYHTGRRDANRNPVTSGFVLLHLQGPAGESVLDQSPLDATTGAYRIIYEPPPDSAGPPGSAP